MNDPENVLSAQALTDDSEEEQEEAGAPQGGEIGISKDTGGITIAAM